MVRAILGGGGTPGLKARVNGDLIRAVQDVLQILDVGRDNTHRARRVRQFSPDEPHSRGSRSWQSCSRWPPGWSRVRGPGVAGLVGDGRSTGVPDLLLGRCRSVSGASAGQPTDGRAVSDRPWKWVSQTPDRLSGGGCAGGEVARTLRAAGPAPAGRPLTDLVTVF